MFKKLLFLSISIAITIAAVIFQRLSGPDEPRTVEQIINEAPHTFELHTVHDDDEDFLVEIRVPDSTITGIVYYKQFNVNHPWKSVKMIRMNETLVSVLPNQKPVMKLEYYLELKSKNNKFYLCKENPVIVRFQGYVPKFLMYPYVILMFVSFIFSLFSAFMSVYYLNSYKKYFTFSYYTFLAGIILGLIIYFVSTRHFIIQFSPHNDLTFYKSFTAFIIFSWAFYRNRKYLSKWYPIIAAVALILFYFVPQSLFF